MELHRLAREQMKQGSYLICDPNSVKLWNVETHEQIATLKGHGSGIRAVAFSPDGTVLASASDDRTVKLWDVEASRRSNVLRGYYKNDIPLWRSGVYKRLQA